SCSVSKPFASCRSRFCAIVFTAFSNCCGCVSTRLTVNPFCANTCAIPLPMVPAPITVIFCILVVSEVAPLPGLDEVGPGHGIEDIHRRRLTLVVVFLGAVFQISARRLSGIGRQTPGEYPAICGT